MNYSDLQLNAMYAGVNAIGYGRLGQEVVRQFEKLGITVFDHLAGTDKISSPVADALMAGRHEILNAGEKSGKANTLLWITVPSHAVGWWKGQHSVIFTMWEATRLPESFRENLMNFAQVIVPSRQNLELFSQFHDNVKMVPLGVDPEVWGYRERKSPERFFRYLIGGSGKRKGTDLAFRAFNKVWGKDGSWGSGPIPILQMKGPRSEDFFRADGRLEKINGHISAEEEVELYATAHCYLQPSRGEGFGLQPLQAIAQGCPTILTDAHGHAEFAPLGWGLSTKLEPSAYFIYGDGGDWWEPSFDDLCEHMRWIYDNYDAAAERAKRSSKWALDHYTWERTAKGVLRAIGTDKLTDYTGPDEWFEPEILLFPIVLKRDRVFDIGAHTYSFKAGQEYHVFSDVKRVLFEGGELDPCCLHDEDPKNCGLTRAQVDQTDTYRAEYANCPTCSRPLNV